MQGKNQNGAMAGAAVGTTAGFMAGALIQNQLNGGLNPWYRPLWKDVGMGISVPVAPNPIPSWAGTALGNATQEKIGPIIQKKVDGK